MKPVAASLWSFVAAVLAAAPPERDDIFKLLDTPVLTSTRTRVRVDRAPATVLVITREQIQQRRYHALVDVLRDLPDIKVDEASDYVGYHSVTVRGLRGFSTQKLLILLNGVRISGPTNEPVPLLDNFPVHMVQRIEVVYGPGSALYGADAFSAVINLIVQVTGRQEVQATLAGGTGGWGIGQVFAEQPLSGGSSLLLSANVAREFPDDLASRFPEDYAGVAKWPTLPTSQPVRPTFEAPVRSGSVLASLDGAPFTANLFHRRALYPSNTANRPDGAVYNADVFLQMELTTLSLEYRETFGQISSRSTLVGQRLAYDPLSNFRNLFTGFNHGYKYGYSTSSRFEQQFTGPLGDKLILTGGAFLEESNAIPQLPELDEPFRDAPGTKPKLLNSRLDAEVFRVRDTQWGAYGQVEYRPMDAIYAVGGLRLDQSERYGRTVNPRLGLIYTPHPRWTAKLLHGQAFLAPSPFDAFAYYGAFQPDGKGGFAAPFMHLPNPGLQPQRLHTTEATLRTALSRHLSLNLTAYRTRVDSLYIQAQDDPATGLYQNRFLGWPVGYVEIFKNQGEAHMNGFTLRMDYLRTSGEGHKIHASAWISHLDGKIADALSRFEQVELPNIAPWTAHASLDLTWGALTFNPRLNWIGRQRLLDMEPGDLTKRRSIVGYLRLDLALGFQLTPHLEGFINVQNGLDATYRNISPQSNLNPIEFVGTPQPPRRVLLGLRGQF